MIDLSEKTLEALRRRVRDFGESPESVIQRLLAEVEGNAALMQRLNYPLGEIRAALAAIPDSSSSRIDILLNSL